MNPSRRQLLSIAATGVASAATLALGKPILAQRLAESEPVTSRQGPNTYIDVINVDLLEEEAKTKLSESVYVLIAHGAGEQWTLRENRRAFGDYVFAPHRMAGVVREGIDASITMLGERFPHPVFISPMGNHGLVHPEAEIATAQGAAKSGGLLCVSSSSTAPLEDIAKASFGPKWFQIYLNIDQGISKELLERVKPAGFKAVVLTIDAIGGGSSDAFARLGASRPRLPQGNFAGGRANVVKTDLSWKDLEFTATTSSLPVVVKGITRPEDAMLAVKAGAAAVQVSNHGGRVLDGMPAAISVLPRIADALQGSVPVIMDSGIRRGMDVAKALALGANAVAVGRPVWWALTVGGAGGVAGLMDFFSRELVNTMLQLGVDKVVSLGREHVLRTNG
jgi:L-lactate oxidase